ncbi:MAG TPA: MFS transporter [Actinoplanes sp.]|nr:MFS transporter [Actinoplanes sp.]
MRLPERDIRLLAGANLISCTGDWALRTGLAYQIYAITGSTAASATAVLAALLPRLLLGPVAGTCADRWDRRRTVIVTNLLLGLCLLPLAAVHGPGQVWIVYLVLAVQSGLAVLFSTAEAALVPALAGDGDLVTANALNGQARDVARLLGAAVGGVVAGFGGIGMLAAVAAGTYVTAAGLLGLIRRRPGTGVTEATRWEGFSGLRIAWSNRTLRVLMVYTVITGIGEAAMSTLMAPFVRDVLGGSAGTYGTIMSAQAVGGLIGGAVTTVVGHRFPPRLLLGGGTLAFGVVDLALFLYPLADPSPWPAVVLIAVAGLPAALTVAGLMTVFQTATDDSHRGRVFGTIVALDSAAMLAATIAAGTLGGRLGIVPVIAVQGVGLCTAGLLVLILLRGDYAGTRAGAPDSRATHSAPS